MAGLGVAGDQWGLVESWRKEVTMPAIEIHSGMRLAKIFDVLIEVGGPFQGVGRDKRILVVTREQHKALVDAGLVKPDGTKARLRGKKATKNRTV